MQIVAPIPMNPKIKIFETKKSLTEFVLEPNSVITKKKNHKMFIHFDIFFYIYIFVMDLLHLASEKYACVFNSDLSKTIWLPPGLPLARLVQYNIFV